MCLWAILRFMARARRSCRNCRNCPAIPGIYDQSQKGNHSAEYCKGLGRCRGFPRAGGSITHREHAVTGSRDRGGAGRSSRYTTVVRLNPRNVAWLLRRTIMASIDDGCFGIAKGAAYSAMLSFFPVLTSAAAILVQTRAEYVARALQNILSEIVPPGTEDLVVQRFRVTGERPLVLLI